MKLYLITILLGLSMLYSCDGLFSNYRSITVPATDSSNLSKTLKDALMHSPRNNLGKQPLPDVKTAVTVAEAYLFKIYGKERIEGERPYLVFKYKGYWFVTGSLTSGAKGGVFDMILNPKDGKVITCTHGK